MKDFVKDIKEKHQEPSCSADNNLQHLIYLLAGYRAFITNDEELQPYSPGSARQISFKEGIAMAKEDIASLPEKFTIQEIKNYLKKRDSLGDAYHYLNAKKIREANESEKNEA
jgi:hypothetical protein